MSAQRRASRRRYRTFLTYIRYFLSISLNTRMLSKQPVQKLSRYLCKVLLINDQKVLGALQSLKGITRYLYQLYRVLKVVFYSSPYLTRILLKVAIMSNLLKNLALASLLRVLRISRIGYRFFIVMSFRPRQLIQKRMPPLGFLISKIGIVVGEAKERIKPLLRCLSRYFLVAINSSQLMPRSLKYRGYLPSYNLISQS